MKASKVKTKIRKCGACQMIAEHGKAYSYLLCYCEAPWFKHLSTEQVTDKGE